MIQDLGRGVAVTFDLPNRTVADGVCRQISGVFFASSSALVGGNTLQDNATGLTNNMQVSVSWAVMVQHIAS